MLTYPDIDPIALNLGPITIRWYGIMYVIAFVVGAYLLKRLVKEKKLKIDNDTILDIIFGAMLGVLLGGRIGYILFYNLPFYFQNPAKIFAIWEGGMSIHGGIIGVFIAFLIIAKKKSIKLYNITDLVVLPGALGLFFGRIGNFINGELYGRITDSPLCMYFPEDPDHCRYPSQLFHAFGEGVLLFIILYIFRNRFKKPGTLTWVFVLLYGIIRFIEEFFREPDTQIGYYFGMLSQGQIFSILMVIAATIMLYRRRSTSST